MTYYEDELEEERTPYRRYYDDRERRSSSSAGTICFRIVTMIILITLLVLNIVLIVKLVDPSSTNKYFVSYRYYIYSTGETGFGDTTVQMKEPIREKNLEDSISGIRSHLNEIVAADRYTTSDDVKVTVINYEGAS